MNHIYFFFITLFPILNIWRAMCLPCHIVLKYPVTLGHIFQLDDDSAVREILQFADEEYGKPTPLQGSKYFQVVTRSLNKYRVQDSQAYSLST